jgi:hypothetical protein
MGRLWHNMTEQIGVCGNVSDLYSEEGRGGREGNRPWRPIGL